MTTPPQTNKVIDIHSHYVHPSVVSAVKENPSSFGIKVIQKAEGISFDFGGSLSRPFFQKMLDLDERLKHMDASGIDVQILSTWVDVFGYSLGPSHLEKFSKLVNDGLKLAVDSNRDRFSAVATLPLPFMDRAVEELDRSVKDLGLVGAMIGTNILDKNLDDPIFDPLWKKAETLNVPIILHPAMPEFGHTLSDYYLKNLLGNPMSTTIAASRLILGGILERHKNLRLVLLHGGGHLLYGIGRIDKGYDVRLETRKHIRNLPSSYLQRFMYDTVVYDSEVLRFMQSRVGNDSIMLGTDYPFDMEFLNQVDELSYLFGKDAVKITSINAQRTFFLNLSFPIF